MLFTRSMRRKLAVVMLAPSFLLIAFVIVSIFGLRSYKATLHDLEVSVANTPSRERLIARISGLIEPLTFRIPDEHQPLELRQRAADWQYNLFVERVTAVYEELLIFEERWQKLTEVLRQPMGQNCATTQLLRDLQYDLKREFADGASVLKDLSNLDRRERHIAEMQGALARMIRTVDKSPDPAYRLSMRLQEAQTSYLYHVSHLYAVGVFGLAVLAAVLLWMQRLILQPLQDLLRGVQRMAMGDFDYRLTSTTSCELSELATAFNEMAERVAGDQREKQQRIEEAARQLLLSERMANLGMLSTGVAHEINNPLMGIANAASELNYIIDDYAEQLSERDREDARHALDVIRNQTKNCQAITRKLQLFGQGKLNEERNQYDLTAIVQEVVSLVHMLKRFPDREVIVQQSEPFRAWIDAGEIRQVVLNIVVNALQATEPGGKLEISLRETPDFVELIFTDNGCGMTPEQLSQIFVPFYTTKETGQGTGLGLSLSRTIVVQHGGSLEASSAGPGQGSTFCLRLPRKAQSLPAKRAA